jgi:hypothetical protein
VNLMLLLAKQYGRLPGADSWDVLPDDLPSSDPRELAAEATREALFRWQEARKRVAEYEASDPQKSDPTNKWGALAYDQVIDAEHALVLAILAWDPGFRDWDRLKAVKQHRKPRGVVVGGIAYLVVPDPDRDESEGEDTADVMRLVVVPMAGVVDLDEA